MAFGRNLEHKCFLALDRLDTMLRTVCRCSKHVDRPLFYNSTAVRYYTQQRTARTPRSSAQQTTTKPSPGAQVKNRPNVPPTPSSSSRSTNAVAPAPAVEQKVAEKVRRDVMAKEARETGQEGELIRMSLKLGNDPWAQKMSLMGEQLSRVVEV